MSKGGEREDDRTCALRAFRARLLDFLGSSREFCRIKGLRRHYREYFEAEVFDVDAVRIATMQLNGEQT